MRRMASVVGSGHALLLEHFQIGAFRGLVAVTLDSLARINLLVGANDSGKTSVLEALALFAAPVDMAEWAAIARSRDVRSFGISGDALSSIDAIRWMFPHSAHAELDMWEEHRRIDLEGHGRFPRRGLRALCERLKGVPPQTDQNRSFFASAGDDAYDEGWLINVAWFDVGQAPVETPANHLAFPLWNSHGLRSASGSRPRSISVEYLAPYAHRNQTTNLKLLTSAVMDGSDNSIGELLSRLDRDVTGVEIVTTPDGKRPAIAIRHKRSGMVPISVLGDGIRRALSIALSVRKARNGLLLIDELEAGLHVSALDRLYPWLVEACIANNVQLVATTHSLEAVEVIARLAEGDKQREMAAYHLASPGSSHPLKRYTGGMLHRLVHEQGLDVR